MSDEQFMPAPFNAGASQKFDALHLLALAARYAVPDTYPDPDATKINLGVRFSGVSAISLPDAQSWLAQAGVQLSTLDTLVSQAASGDAEPLHQALQAGNDAHLIQFLAINDASKLVELADAGEDTPLSPNAMWSKPDPCLLLRYGYNPENGYAYYAASLPGDSYRPIKITWESVVAAGVNAAVAILPPPPKVDVDLFNQAAEIMKQALNTAAQAYMTMQTAIGQQAAEVQQVPEQAVS